MTTTHNIDRPTGTSTLSCHPTEITRRHTLVGAGFQRPIRPGPTPNLPTSTFHPTRAYLNPPVSTFRPARARLNPPASAFRLPVSTFRPAHVYLNLPVPTSLPATANETAS
jgi:hypothetical protein